MSTTVTGPEKARHIDDRVAHIDTAGLIAAFGNPQGVDDLASVRRFVSARMRRVAWPLSEWAAAVRGSDQGNTIIAEADPLLDGVDVTGAVHGRSRRYGFHYLNWLSVGVQAWLLTKDDRYLHAFERHFDEWFKTRDSVTGEWPGLDVIWYSLGTWARCRNLLPILGVVDDSGLSDETWGRIVSTLVGGARWAFDEHDRFRHGNWQLASATELMHIGYVLPDLVEASAWVERGRERVDEHLLLDVYRDGGHYERSPGYHMMCVSALQLAAVVDTRYGPGDLARQPKLSEMHRWLCSITSGGGWTPHLQDSGIEWPARTLLRGSYVLDDPAFARVARQWLPAADFDREAMSLPPWTDEARQKRWEETVSHIDSIMAPEPTLTTVLPDSGYAILRSDAGQDALRAVVNYGPHIEHELESHSHRAVLDFTLEGWKLPLLWEAGGPPSYDDPKYLSWYQSARGHNTVLVDDEELQTDRESQSEAIVDTGRLAVFRGRHRGHRMLQSRQLILVRSSPAVVVVEDRASADDESPADSGEPHTFQLRLQAVHPWQTDGPLSFRSSAPDGPEVRVLEVGAPEETTVAFSEGRARRPDPTRSSAEYGALHTLMLDRAHGGFTTVVLPRRTAGAATGVARRDGDVLVIDHGEVIDRVEAASWVRTSRLQNRQHADGEEVLNWASGWDVRELVDRGSAIFRCTVGVDVEVNVGDRGAASTWIDAPGRCRIGIRVSDDETGSSVRLNDVAVDPYSVERNWVVLTVPYGGQWTVTGVRVA